MEGRKGLCALIVALLDTLWKSVTDCIRYLPGYKPRARPTANQVMVPSNSTNCYPNINLRGGVI